MRRRNGFTLIELVLVMVLMGIVGATFTMCLTYGFAEYLQAKDTVEMSQKARLALTRMYVELAEAQGLDTANTANIDESGFFYIDHAGNAASIELFGSSLVMNGQFTLVDTVAAYSGGDVLFTYLDPDGNAWTPADGFDELAEIDILLNLDNPISGGARSFTHSVNPRRSVVPNAPKLE